MKKFGLLWLMPFLAVLGCDDKEEALKNVLDYDGDRYVLKQAGSYISDYGISDAGFHNYVFALSDGSDYDENGPEGASIVVLLSLNSLSDDGFKTGTYNFSGQEEPDDDFMDATSGIVVDEDTVNVSGGNVSINKSGNRWIINYDLEMENDKTASGEFEAILDVVDLTD